jgi:hypothetical protein
MNEPTLFKPHALAKAPIVCEGRIERDLSMPERDWSEFDSPAYLRRTSKVIRNERRQAAA